MATRTLSARQAVADIRSGMDNPALMKRCHLSPDGLRSLFDKLIRAGGIDISELEGRLYPVSWEFVISRKPSLQGKDLT
jgi:hypothetical protein